MHWCCVYNTVGPLRPYCFKRGMYVPIMALTANTDLTTPLSLPSGTGYAVLHCHIAPHSDEGCMIRVQFLANRCGWLFLTHIYTLLAD